MNGLRWYAIDAGLILLAIVLQVVALPAGWVENTYANGIYAALARTFVPLANAAPFAIGDVILCAIGLGLCSYWIVTWRTGSRSRLRCLAKLVLRTAAALALVIIWFDGAWALNYRRVPIVNRIAFDPARVTAHNVSSYSASIVAALNATAPLAHAEHRTEAQMQTTLAAAFDPVVRRLGDRYDVTVSQPKKTAFNWWFEMAGIGGQWDPFAYETLVNASFLPFERPFAIAHEWGHVAGFGDESDANLIAALTTMRSKDAFIRYSGLFWSYGFLPDTDRRVLRLSPLVLADLRAAQARFLRNYNPKLFALQWYVYDKYLRANRVTAGVVSYSLFVQVLVGTPLDRDGLPRTREKSARRNPPPPVAVTLRVGD